ncbi:hypothetical protein [Oceanirhabdus seepicola]|uniref:Uncharacterized protein n=1 Tax=Oceanirhabdus seepicola TaxID=2828781 RepID=A0A9J6NW95_9CLOT|nr:hypothetical protein [Oceanirhabdus seepicola]MCM1988270.1 hypothetical protein [Oceanirhabdus seepicola]
MGQFDKNQRIRFKLNDHASLTDALKQYKVLLQQDEVVIHQVYDIDFVYVEDGEDHPLLLEHAELEILEKIRNISESDYYTERDFNSTGSEGLFFSHCLKHPQLKSEIVDTVKEIVNYSRRHNDTWEMWSDDCGVFGIDPVYMLAEKYHEYTYLIGAYIIPYWDTEHAPYVMEYLERIYLDRGFTDDVLKTFCYCDNIEGRQSILSKGWQSSEENPFDLEAYFKETPERYKRFKTLMKERFKEQPYLQYTEDDYTDRPVEDFYRSILYSRTSDDEDYYDFEDLDLEEIFIEGTYDNEAYNLQTEIEDYIGKPLAEPYKDSMERYDKESEEALEDDTVWEDFFLNGFENGEEMWNYIMYGEDDSILDKIQPVDILKLSKDKKLKISKKFDWFIGGFDSLEGEFPRIFESFLEQYYDVDQALRNNGMIISINGNDTTGRQAVICALDIFYRLMGRPVFSYDLFELITSSKVMTPSAFRERYHNTDETSMKSLTQLIADFSTSREVFSPQLDRIYEIINEDRSKALSLFQGKALDILDEKEVSMCLSKDLLNRPYQIELYKQGLLNKTHNIVMSMYLLYKDYQNRVMDDLSKFLLDFVEKNAITNLMNVIKNYSDLTDEELETVKKYIKGKPMPPRELMMKAMMGKEPLTDEEKSLLNPKFEPVKLEEAVDLLRIRLEHEINSDDPQIHYEIFSDYEDDSINILLAALYLGSCKFNLPSSKAYKNAYTLLFELAPIKVINSTSYLYHSSYRSKLDNVDYWYDFERDMKKISKDKSSYLAWELLDNDDPRYDALVQAYIDDEENSGFSFIKVDTREDIEKALSLLPVSNQTRFYEEVTEKDDSIVIDGQAKIFYGYIPMLIKESHVNSTNVSNEEIHSISNDLIDFIEGNIELTELDYTKSIIEDLSPISGFTENLWALDETKRNRLFDYIFQFGLESISAAYDRYNVEPVDYLELLINHKVEYNLISSFLVKYGDYEAFSEYLKIYNPSEHIKEMNIDTRIKALELASGTSLGKEFINDFLDDPSDRVNNYAKSLL